MPNGRQTFAALGLVMVASASISRAAEDQAERHAKALYLEGMKYYNLQEYQAALSRFKGGYLEKPDPAFLFNIGQCHRKMNHPADAAESYQAYLRANPNAPNRADVEQFIAEEQDQIKQRQALPPIVEQPKPVEPISAAGNAALTAPPPGTPLYRRWWLWTAVGGAVAVGAGIAVGIAAITPRDAPIPQTSAGNGTVMFP